MANWSTSMSDELEIRHGYKDLDLVGGYNFTLGVPWNAPIEFKRKVIAAAKAYILGIKSIDYFLKKYGDELEFQSNKENLMISKYIHKIKVTIGQALDYFISLDKPDIPSLYFSLAALFRLQNTFQAVLLCIKQNLYFEASSLSRMILEQLSWIYRVHKLEFIELFDTRPNDCIKYLKPLFLDVGRLYGELSNSVHLSPAIIPDYVDKDLSIRMGDVKQSYKNLYILFHLTDIFCVVGESIYVNYKLIDDPKYINIKNGNITPDQNRITLKYIREFLEEVKVIDFSNSH
jgi:hypothetical protein